MPPQRAGFAPQPAPFVQKTYDMIMDPSTDAIISWTADGTAFTVFSTEQFSANLLPLHFKHNNFSSFVRQLNTYRFRKVDPDSWTFKNDYFVRGRADQLGLITRKTSDTKPGARPSVSKQPVSNVQPALEVGAYGGYGNASLDAVRRDNALLRQEVIRLRHEMEVSQAHSETKMSAMEKKMDRFERERRSLIAGIAQALQHPGLMQHLVASSPNVMRIEDGRRKRKVAKKNKDGDVDVGVIVENEDSDEDVNLNNQQLVVHQSQQAPFADLAKQFMQMLTTSAREDVGDLEAFGSLGLNTIGNLGPLVEEAEISQASPRPSNGVSNDGMGLHNNTVHPLVVEPIDADDTYAQQVGVDGDLTLSPNLDNINLDDFDLGSIGDFDGLGTLPSMSGAMSLTESDIERIANHK